MSDRLSERERNIIKAALFLDHANRTLGYVPDYNLFSTRFGLSVEEMRAIRDEVQS